jgi:predicted DNA-binding transcriptional regulator AlpA
MEVHSLFSDSNKSSNLKRGHFGPANEVAMHMSKPPQLPDNIAKNRILDSAQSAAFIGLSLPHFRRLHREGSVPKAIRLGARKLGWRAGDLVDWLAAREALPAPCAPSLPMPLREYLRQKSAGET